MKQSVEKEKKVKTQYHPDKFEKKIFECVSGIFISHFNAFSQISLVFIAYLLLCREFMPYICE